MRPILRLFSLALICSAALAPVYAQDSRAAQDTQDAQEKAAENEYRSYSDQAQILVIDKEKTAEQLIRWTESQGGYFIEKSLDKLVLKVPTAMMPDLRQQVRGLADELLSYDVQSRDLRQELAGVRAGIAGREENLERVLEYIDDTNVSGTLALEREIGSLMREIESLKGRERLLLNQKDYGRAEVYLSTRQTQVPGSQVSAFPWLNTLDLYSFLQEVGR